MGVAKLPPNWKGLKRVSHPKPSQPALSTGEILTDSRRNGKERPWAEYKRQSSRLSKAYALLDWLNLSNRVNDCADWLKFGECPNGCGKKLVAASFCRVRLCPMCAQRRSALLSKQVAEVCHDAATINPGLRFIFLTLTVPNVTGGELQGTVDHIFKSWRKLCTRAVVKRVMKGFFRSLEITHNKETDTWHPHMHVLLVVNNTYFNGPYYIKREKWLDLWRGATGQPEITQVDVRAVKSKKTGRTDDPEGVADAAAEVAKYAVKYGDLLTDATDEELTRSVRSLHNALAGRRLVEYGGVLATSLARIDAEDLEGENADLVGLEHNGCNCQACGANLEEQLYRWFNGEYLQWRHHSKS